MGLVPACCPSPGFAVGEAGAGQCKTRHWARLAHSPRWERGAFSLNQPAMDFSPCKPMYFSMHSCPWAQASISHPQGPVKVSSTAARRCATNHQTPTMLPTQDSTRNCLLLVGHDFAALSHNAPDCLSQRKSPVALVIPHTETTSPAGSPPSMGSESCRVWLSQDFLFLPAPAGPPHHPQLIAASPTPPGLDAQLPQTGSEESPALCPLFWGCCSPKG